MNDKQHMQEYAELVEEWTRAEADRQRYADRLQTLDGPIALNDPIWEGWDKADETAGHARQAVRSFLAAEEHSRQS